MYFHTKFQVPSFKNIVFEMRKPGVIQKQDMAHLDLDSTLLYPREIRRDVVGVVVVLIRQKGCRPQTGFI